MWRRMTVEYSNVVNTSSFYVFTRILLRWKGSLWKAVYIDLLLWLSAYAVIAVIYNYALDDNRQRIFEGVCEFFVKYEHHLPLTFMLGFYVSLVITRWWSMYLNIGWIDSSALLISYLIDGSDEAARLMRRNIIRHMLLYQVLVYRDICLRVRERFPTLETCVSAGYLTTEEYHKFRNFNSQFPQYWVPIRWALSGIKRARREGRIPTDRLQQDLSKEILEFRSNLGTLLAYDWVPVPLLYTQVVTLSVRLFFLTCLFGRQNLKYASDSTHIDPINIYIPLISIFQFIFYMGWLKVAEALLNPFGGDDDDFEINWLLDRNLEVGYMVVDDQWEPPLVKDRFWNEKVLNPLYSLDSVISGRGASNPLVGSAQNASMRRTSLIMIPKRSFLYCENDRISDKDVLRTRSRSFTGMLDVFREKMAISRRNNIFRSSFNNNIDAEVDTHFSIENEREERGEIVISPTELTVVQEEDEQNVKNKYNTETESSDSVINVNDNS